MKGDLCPFPVPAGLNASALAGQCKNLTASLLLIGIILLADVAWGHESQPGTLDLRQLSGDSYRVTWKAPIYYGKPHPAKLQLPATWQDKVQPVSYRAASATVFERVVQVGEKGVQGKLLRFPGLEGTITDVFVRLTRLDGTTMSAVVRPTKPYVSLRGERPWTASAADYTILGFHHILMGIDHLLFVLGLLLIVRDRVMLVKTITSFTLAHSITLGVATLGLASLPLPPLNAAIALSILFLGPEIVRSLRGETSLTIRHPWGVAFVFGLLHGFGFASGLSTTGMPGSELPLALLFFNIGVELGQLGFVMLIFLMMRAFRIFEFRWARWSEYIPAYLIGSFGAYWTLQRTMMLFTGL